MNQVSILALHVAVFLSVLIFCALLAMPVRMLFQTKLEPSKDKTEVASIVPEAPLLKPEIDYRSLKKCPYDYHRVLESFHMDSYDENCQLAAKKAKPKKPPLPPPPVRFIRRVVMRKVCHPHKKKGAVQSRCLNMNVVEEVPETEASEEVRDNSFPYVSELILKMVLIGLMISAVVERVNFYFMKNVETAGTINGTPRRSSSKSERSHFPRPKHNHNDSSSQNNGCTNYNQPAINANNYSSKYGSLGARPSSLVRRSSCPTDSPPTREPIVYDGSPNLRCLRRNTLMFRRR